MSQTKWLGGQVIKTMQVGAYNIAKAKASEIERLAKINMDPLYASNYRWSKIHPDLKAEARSGLARVSIHVTWKKTEHAIRIGSDAETMRKGVAGITGSKTYYFPYLEFGTWAIPPLGMLRKAFDEVKRGM